MPDRSLNRCLAIMPKEAESFLKQQGKMVRFEPGDTIVGLGGLDDVYFFKEGFASLIDPDSGIELAIITPDGIAGHPAVLGLREMTMVIKAATVVRALKLSTQDLDKIMEDRAVRSVLLEVVNELIIQLSTSVVSSAGFVKQRLARWLLLACEAHGDELDFTHQQIADWLAVRRPGVTIALHELEGEHLIRCTRAKVRVLDRDGLRLTARAARSKAA